MIKRTIDLIIAISALVVFLPIMALLSALILIRTGPPVFFCQLRPGLGGRPFKIYKFRTMALACDPQDSPQPDEARLTRVGRWMRNLSLDELPEFFNVLRGDMSLVGPRPLLMQYLCRYTPRQARRHSVKPGLTGLTQVSGRNELTWERKFDLDIWYVDNATIPLDLKILALTVWKTITREGVNQPGRATMDEFMGSPESH